MCTQEEHHVKMKAEPGKTRLPAKGCQRLPSNKLGEKQGTGSLSELPGKNPAHHLILAAGLQLNVCCVKSPSLWVSCHSTPRVPVPTGWMAGPMDEGIRLEDEDLCFPGTPW